MYKTSHLRASLFICDKMGRCKSYFSSNWQDRCLIITNCRLNFLALAFPTQKVSADSIIIPPRFMRGFSRRRQTRYKTRCLGNKEWPQVCRCQAFRQSRSPRPEGQSAPPYLPPHNLHNLLLAITFVCRCCRSRGVVSRCAGSRITCLI